MNISCPAGIPLVSRMDQVIIDELLLMGGQREENGLKEENRVVMQCYYRSDYGRNGYRKRIHVI